MPAGRPKAPSHERDSGMVLLGIDTQKDIVAAGQTTGSDITVVAGYVVFLGGLAPIGWRIMIGRTEQARA